MSVVCFTENLNPLGDWQSRGELLFSIRERLFTRSSQIASLCLPLLLSNSSVV